MDPSIRMRRPLIELLRAPRTGKGGTHPGIPQPPRESDVEFLCLVACLASAGRAVVGCPAPLEARPMTRFEIYLRSLLRRAGLTRALRFHWALRNRWHARRYRASRPEKLEVGVDGWKAEMLVGSAGEYTMLRSKKEDYALVRLLG